LHLHQEAVRDLLQGALSGSLLWYLMYLRSSTKGMRFTAAGFAA
jgi:hypothetical protein